MASITAKLGGFRTHFLNRIRASAGFGQVKLRDLHFDVLIALTARSYGAQVITTNKLDFELNSNACRV